MSKRKAEALTNDEETQVCELSSESKERRAEIFKFVG